MKEIDGQKVIEEFTVLHYGWEMDNTGWITEDGRVWMTSHGGRPVSVDIEVIESHIEETADSLEGLLKAKRIFTWKHPK